MASSKRNFDITLYEWESVAPGEKFTVTLNVRNSCEVNYQGGRIFVKGDRYFQNNAVPLNKIEQFQSANVEVTIFVNPGSIRDIPPTVSFEIKEGNNIIFSTLFSLRVAFFNKDLTRHRLTEDAPVNILLFGLAGATKSSFINSILTMLAREDKIVTAAAAGGTARHQTTKLVRYELSKQLEGLHVNLFDTWGLTNKTYQGTELERILNGELPVNWKMEDAIEDNAQKLRQFQGSMAARRIHTVIFFIPQSALSDQSQEPIRKAIGFYYTKILHLGYTPMLMLTRVDEVNGEVRKQPLGKYPDLEELKIQASRLLNIPPMHIFYNVNYVAEHQKSFEIDRMNYLILSEAIERAVNKLKFTDDDELMP